MPITVTNLLVSGPILVPLATGGTVRLSPGQTSVELSDADATNNPTLDKLVQRGMVEVRSTGKASGGSDSSASVSSASGSSSSGSSPGDSSADSSASST